MRTLRRRPILRHTLPAIVLGAIAAAAACVAAEEAEEPPSQQQQEQQQQQQPWTLNPLAWRAEAEGFRAEGLGGFAVRSDVPRCGRVTVEAEVRVERSVGPRWKVAGVVVYDDRQNFWQLALAEAPDDEGTVLADIRYEFTAEAVTAGRPGLRSEGFVASLRAVRSRGAAPVPDEAAAFPPYRSDSFVPGVRGEATGFFRVEERDGRWWTLDPLGRGYVVLGVDHVSYNGHWSEALNSRNKYSFTRVRALKSFRWRIPAGTAPPIACAAPSAGPPGPAAPAGPKRARERWSRLPTCRRPTTDCLRTNWHR